MQYTFDSEVAMAVGSTAATILNHLAFWVTRNEANGANFHDGKYWTFNSIKAFCHVFPFWTHNTIYRALHELESGGYIETGNFNTVGTNRTKWYTLTEKGRSIIGKSIFEKTKMDFGQNKNGTLPEQKTTNTDKNSTDIKHTDTRARKRTLTVPFQNPSPELLEAWNGFVEYRKSIRTPLNERAAKLTANKLEKYAPGDDAKKAALLNQSVERGWKGIYPLDSDKKQRGSRGYPQTQTVEEMYEEAQKILKNGGGFL